MDRNSSAPGATDPDPAPAAEGLEAATALHRAGKLAEARALYVRHLAARPEDALARFRLGLLELQENHADAAVALLEQAVAGAPHEARFHFGHGQALTSLGRWAEAAEAYERALARDATLADAWVALGIARGQRGDAPGACDAFRRALAIDEATTGAAGHLGAALLSLGEVLEAVSWLERARALEPAVPEHTLQLGLAQARLGRHEVAAATLHDLIERDPMSAETAFARAQALKGLGRAREALAAYRQALLWRPGFSQALINLGNLHRELGELVEARAAYERALETQPDDPVAINNLAALLRLQGRLDEAEDLLRRGLALAPHHAVLHDTLGNVLKDQGSLPEALECFRRSLAIDPRRAATHSNLVYSLSFQAREPTLLLEEARRWQARFAASIERARAWHGERMPERRLRIGYVSPDFREHCQSLFMQPLLANHDHESFEIVCYSSVVRPDACTQRLAAHADRWHEVTLLSDAALAELIHRDAIDVLVDLTMHMAGGRPLLFARKPAPVQIAWLAYPGTTGLEAMDHRLSDPRLDPPGSDENYTEHTWRLPDSFWCYDPLSHEPAVSALPALDERRRVEGAVGRLTFGCLNNPCKLTDDTLALWAPLLRALPQTRLRLLAPPGRSRERLAARFGAHGVDPARLEFVEFRPRAGYLQCYQDIDLGLDTVPYNGHTTSLDALWMGVPTVTRIGPTVVGRAGLSQLHVLGLGELAASSDAEFLEIALTWAHDLARLARLRCELRARLERSALMQAGRFARAIEEIYRAAWREYCARR